MGKKKRVLKVEVQGCVGGERVSGKVDYVKWKVEEKRGEKKEADYVFHSNF